MPTNISSRAPDGTSAPDPFALPSGAKARLLLLVTALLGTSVFVYNTAWLTFAPEGGRGRELYRHCASGAGQADPVDAFLSCTAAYEHRKAVWVGVGIALLLLVTAALYWADPKVRVRREKLEAFEPEADPEQAALVDWLSVLVAEAGLRQSPRFLLRLGSSRAQAVTFGRAGWYAVRLDAGLATWFRADPARLRAVVLHELAHLRNRDTDVECLTRSLTLAFWPTVLLPLAVTLIGSPPGDVLDIGWRALALFAMVFYARVAVLRACESAADVRAASWTGAREDVLRAIRLRAEEDDGRTPWWRKPAALHPGTARRVRLVMEPRLTFRVGFLDGCVAGLATMSALTGFQTLLWLTLHDPDPLRGRWTASLVFAPVVTAVIGLGLWRTTRLTGAPRGTLPPALGLGVGLVLGRPLAVPNGILLEWKWPWPGATAATVVWSLVLLALLCLFTWWIAQVAAVWPELPGGRGAAGLGTAWAAATFVLSVLLAWWLLLHDTVDGIGVINEGARADHRAVARVAPAGPYGLWAAVEHPFVKLFAEWTPTPVALALLWALPLLAPAFLVAGRVGRPLVVGIPSGRLVVAASGAAAAFFACAVLIVRLLIHTEVSSATRADPGFLLAFEHWSLAAAMVTQGVVAAAVAAILLARRDSAAACYGLLTAFVTGCSLTAVHVGGMLVGSCVETFALRPVACTGPSATVVRNLLLRVLVGGGACAVLALLAVALLAPRLPYRKRPPAAPLVPLAPGGRAPWRHFGVAALLLACGVTLFAWTVDKNQDAATTAGPGSDQRRREDVRRACLQYDALLGALASLPPRQAATRLDEAARLAERGGEPRLATAFIDLFGISPERPEEFEKTSRRIQQICGTVGVVMVNLP